MEPISTDKPLDDPSDRIGRFEADVDHRFDKVDRRFDRFEDRVDERFDKVDARFEKVDERFDKVDARFEKVDEQLGGLVTKEEFQKRMEELNSRFDSWGRLVKGGVASIVVGVILKLLGV